MQRGIRKGDFDIQMRITGLFVHEDVFYYRFELENNSNINFDIDQFRFFIRDLKKAKRTASQEIEIQPLVAPFEVTKIPAVSLIRVVVALPKFSLAEKKYVAIELLEKEGGRHLSLSLKQRRIGKVSTLPNL